MENSNKSPLDKLLDEITPLEQAQTDAKMMLAARIADAMRAKNWKNTDLLAAVGKFHPSVVTQWLSGTHNFTVETLVELEKALEISLLNLGGKNREIVIKYTQSEKIEKKNEAPPSLNLDNTQINEAGNFQLKRSNQTVKISTSRNEIAILS